MAKQSVNELTEKNSVIRGFLIFSVLFAGIVMATQIFIASAAILLTQFL